MACCAIGPCDRSKERGGKGCYLCDRVSKNLVHPAPMKPKDSVTRREQALTSKQARKAKK